MGLRHYHRRPTKPMCPLGYYPMLRRSTEPTYLRFELVRYAREHGIKPAARQFSTTPRRCASGSGVGAGSLRGLARPEPRATAPASGHHPQAQRRLAVTLKRRLPSWGASRLKRDFPLPLSEKASVPHLARGRTVEAETAEAQDQAVPAGGEERRGGSSSKPAWTRRTYATSRSCGRRLRRHGPAAYQYTAREVTWLAICSLRAGMHTGLLEALRRDHPHAFEGCG